MENKENIKYLTKEEIDKMNFFEAAYYVQTLNQIEKLKELEKDDKNE